MKPYSVALACLVFSSISIAQTVSGLEGAGPGSNLNQQSLMQRRSAAMNKNPQVVVFTGDRVIPQFVDGGSWKTSMFFVNLENHSVSFQVLFFEDDGSDMLVQILGQGTVRGLNVTLE